MSIELLQSSGKQTKLTDEVLQVIETAMQDETTVQLQKPHISQISLCTMLKG